MVRPELAKLIFVGLTDKVAREDRSAVVRAIRFTVYVAHMVYIIRFAATLMEPSYLFYWALACAARSIESP